MSRRAQLRFALVPLVVLLGALAGPLDLAAQGARALSDRSWADDPPGLQPLIELTLTAAIEGAGRSGGPAAFTAITPAIAARAVKYLQEGLREPLESWYEYYFGFDPLFTWWARVPYEELIAAMDAYITAIQREWPAT